MTMDDVRAYENKTKADLDQVRIANETRGEHLTLWLDEIVFLIVIFSEIGWGIFK